MTSTLSKLSIVALIAAIGILAWTLYPATMCSMGQEAGSLEEGELHDWMYGRGEGGEQMDFGERVTGCFSRLPPTMGEPWRLPLAGGLFLFFIIGKWMSGKAYARQIKKGSHSRSSAFETLDEDRKKRVQWTSAEYDQVQDMKKKKKR